jgi:ferredoxin-NADP reductase
VPTPVKLPVVVEDVVRYGSDVEMLVLRPLKKCPRFKPGQFLHLALDPYDPTSNWPESRVFSIASSPTRSEQLKVVFSIKGAFTRRMYGEITKGRQLFIKLPYGVFTFPEDERDLVFIAGGTGVTPYLSYLQYVLDQGIERNIALYYGVREAQYLVGTDLLADCLENLAGFSMNCYLEQNTAIPGFPLAGTGWIPSDVILAENTHRPTALFYLSGPPEMVKNFTDLLIANGTGRSQVVVDEWE